MPATPEPRGASPDLMPFLRWVRETLMDMINAQKRQSNSDANTNSSQNSTMSVLVERLGTVESIMNSIGSSLTIDASQVVSGTLAVARVPNLDASKIATGTITNTVNTGGTVTATGDITSAGNGTFNNAWNYDVSAVTRRAVWMDASGRLGQTASTEYLKRNIQDYAPSESAVRNLRLVSFQWQNTDSNHVEVGLVAQQLHNLGLRWLVDYEVDGKTIHGVHYERLALAFIPLVQRLADELDDTRARLEDMELRLAALEGN